MKNIKIRAAVYVLVFIAAAVLTYIFTIGKNVYNNDTTTMSSAGLPVIYMTSEGGIKYNYLHGYTGEVNQKLLHDVITPVDDTRKMIISVRQYGCAISGISYEITTVDQEVLIERNDVSDCSGLNGIIIADLQFKNLLETGTEYLLKITLNTEKYGEVAYFTRLVKLDDPQIQNKLQYVNDFSENTSREETLGKVTAKLETDSTGDNTNLGRVNIHSKLSQVGFADLEPELISDRYFTINEIDEDRASISVTYQARTSDDSGTFDYNIKEYYRIYQPDTTVTYVYNFERWMNQKFNPQGGISGRGEVYLGIRSDTDVAMKSSSNGKISAFVTDGNLWSFSCSKNSFTKVFTFEDSDSDGVRENYQAHDIKILNVNDNGNVDFLVYGYMNRGGHEGELGISVYKFDAAKRSTEEIAFIPRTDSYELIANDINKLAYMNENNILYIYSNHSVFYLDCTTREYMVIAGDILDDISSMCEESAIYVYQNGSDINKCRELNILNLNTGAIYTVKSGEGESIKMLGFIDGNVVYGKLENDMLTVTDAGNIIAPMYIISIMNSENEIVREYQEDNMYVTQARFGNSQIFFERVTYNEEGVLVSASSDSVLSNVEDTSKSMEIITRATDFRQKEQYISLVMEGSSNANSTTAKYVFSENTTVLISEIYDQTEEYYFAYGFGELYKICYTLADAMAAAYESGGVVVDSNALTVWNRYKDQSRKISLPGNIFESDESSLIASTNALFTIAGVNTDSANLYENGYSTLECLKSEFGAAVDLTGSEIDLALYFVGKGNPIIAKTGENKYELVFGYDTNNVYTCDFEEKAVKTYTKSEFNAVISQYDNILITY